MSKNKAVAPTKEIMQIPQQRLGEAAGNPSPDEARQRQDLLSDVLGRELTPRDGVRGFHPRRDPQQECALCRAGGQACDLALS
jgi:hypothetical protein